MAQISAMVSNGAMAQPTQCSPCLSKTRAARGSLAKRAATCDARFHTLGPELAIAAPQIVEAIRDEHRGFKKETPVS